MMAGASGSQKTTKTRTLQDLFRPPIDIIYKGTFANVRCLLIFVLCLKGFLVFSKWLCVLCNRVSLSMYTTAVVLKYKINQLKNIALHSEQHEELSALFLMPLSGLHIAFILMQRSECKRDLSVSLFNSTWQPFAFISQNCIYLYQARETGKKQGRWLMVNIQNVQEFTCQALNRDIWSNSTVKALLKDSFIFWQVMKMLIIVGWKQE